MSPLTDALNLILDRVCLEIHNAYMVKVMRDIQTLRLLKSFSYDTDELPLNMIHSAEQLLEYTLYKLILIDPMSI